jgi:hypothetical protein
VQERVQQDSSCGPDDADQGEHGGDADPDHPLDQPQFQFGEVGFARQSSEVEIPRQADRARNRFGLFLGEARRP